MVPLEGRRYSHRSRPTSFPLTQIKILLLENISSSAIELFNAEAFSVVSPTPRMGLQPASPVSVTFLLRRLLSFCKRHVFNRVCLENRRSVAEADPCSLPVGEHSRVRPELHKQFCCTTSRETACPDCARGEARAAQKPCYMTGRGLLRRGDVQIGLNDA